MKNRIEISRLFEIGVEILEHAGTGRDNAGIQVDALLSTEFRGHPSHEFLRLPRLAERIEAGVVHPNGRGSFSRHGNSLLQVDGRRGLEPVVMAKAIRRLQELVSDREIAILGGSACQTAIPSNGLMNIFTIIPATGRRRP